MFGSTTNQPTGSTGGLFGSTNTNASTTGGVFGSGNTGGGLFGSNNNSGGGIFGANNTGSSGFFGNSQNSFGQGLNANKNPFGTPIQGNSAQSNQSNISAEDKIRLAVNNPVIFGNYKDTFISKLNQLKAFSGHGRIFFAQNGFVDLSSKNEVCGFKTVTFYAIPQTSSQENTVIMYIEMTEAQLNSSLSKLKDGLLNMLGAGANISVCIHNIVPVSATHTTVEFFVVQQNPNTEPITIPSSQIIAALSQTQNAQKLQSELKVKDLKEEIKFNQSEVKMHSKCPPAGIDVIQWKKICDNNPDPAKLIPVPIYGYKELEARFNAFYEQKTIQKERIQVIF